MPWGFHPLATWDQEALLRLFREQLLARLALKHAISQELATKLMAWRHPGFSAHVGEPIAADDAQALENLAGYVVRNPLSLQRLVYLDGQQAVIYKGLKHNPTLGRNFETMDPLEWLARLADQICAASWARLIAKVFYADPLTCRKCGGKLKIVAYLHDHVAIKQILDHLGLRPPEDPRPPPAVHEVVRAPGA